MFETSAASYNFYKNTNVSVMEARTEAINAEIRSNAQADMAALAIELEGIEQAIAEKRSEGNGNQQQPEQPKLGFTATSGNGGAGAESAEYRSAFFKTLLGQRLDASEHIAFKAVNAEKRAAEFNTLSNSAAVIPTTTLDQILVKARDEGGIMSLARAFAIPANVSVPVATPGSAAQWHTEGATVDSEKVEPASVTFGAYEIMRVLSMSAAAQTMSISAFEAYLTDELTASVMSCISKAMVDGDGVNKATGIIPGITWTEGENQLTCANGIGWRDLLRGIAMLHRGYSRNATFVLNNRTLYTSIFSLHDDADRPIYIDDATEKGGARLLGFPVVVDDFVPDDEILFGDFSYYGFNMPAGIAIDMSRESSFRSGLIDYRALAIVDAKPIIPEAFVRISQGA